MSLFNKVQIAPETLSYIQKGEGVGVVKLNNLGKFSAIINQNKVILNSYEGQNDIVIRIPDINLIQYDEGNFIMEPKLIIGAEGSQFELAGVDNNDDELNRFYQTLLDLRQQQENLLQNKQSNNNSMPHPHRKITNPNKLINSENNFNSEVNNKPMQDTINNDYSVQNDTEDSNSIDPVSEIRRYYELKEDGIISEEEFNQKKKQLLDL